MRSEVTATHTSITPTKIRVPCNCSKGYHLFGSAGDQNSCRVGFRGMHGHGCSKYTDCKIHIGQSTLKVQNLPATKIPEKINEILAKV